MNRKENLSRLQNESFDICIIGAGATGAGIAVDAATRGLKVALIDAGDFAGQTSSKSTKLIHGGVRYLEQAFKKFDGDQLRMVYKALGERRTLLKLAPHLTNRLALLTPCKNWFEAIYYTIGLKLYDVLSGKGSIGDSSLLSKSKVQKAIPKLNTAHLSHAVKYYDGQLDDARYCLALVQTAHKEGAAVANYIRLQKFVKKEGATKIYAAQLNDELSNSSFQLKAKVFINATGPFTDHIRQLANSKLEPRMKVSRGAHIVLDKNHLQSNEAILVPKTDDGRVLFIIPWQNHTLVGTTDDADQLDGHCVATPVDRSYLLDYANRFLTTQVTEKDILSSWAGQRPLLQASFSTDTKSLVRDHEVEVDRRTKLVSIMGGKWTTYRLMAKDTLDTVYKEVWEQKPVPCKTDHVILFGSEGYSAQLAADLEKTYQLPADIAIHLCSKYGVQARVIAQDRTVFERIVPNYPYTKAEIAYVIQNEMATDSTDLSRRIGVLYLNDAVKSQITTVAEKLL